MTTYLIDVASYQRGIKLDVVKAAGFTCANVKTSQGNHYTFSDARTYADAAHARGMGVSLFHWLDNSATGKAQADYCWRTAGPIVGDVGRVAFQVDNEDTTAPATWAITRDFVNAIADHLGHLPFMYTGDWWAQSGGRAQWNVASLTPWLMAAPNAGYLGTYPGDSSAHWRAGYWGYTNLSLMQYAVGTIANAGGGDISKAAIRDPNLWAALTGAGGKTVSDFDPYGKSKAAGDREVGVLISDVWGNEINGVSPYDGKTPSLRSTQISEIRAGVAELRAQAAAETVRDAAVKSTVDGLVATIARLLASGGGSTDLSGAAIMDGIAQARDVVRAEVQDLHDALDEANTDRAAQRAEVLRLTSIVEATLSPAEAAAVDDSADETA